MAPCATGSRTSCPNDEGDMLAVALVKDCHCLRRPRLQNFVQLAKLWPAGKACPLCAHTLCVHSNIRCGVALESVQCLNNYRLFGAQGCSGRQNWCRSCGRGGETSSAPALLLPLEASAVPTAWCRRGKRVPPAGKHGCRQNSRLFGRCSNSKSDRENSAGVWWAQAGL